MYILVFPFASLDCHDRSSLSRHGILGDVGVFLRLNGRPEVSIRCGHLIIIMTA